MVRCRKILSCSTTEAMHLAVFLTFLAVSIYGASVVPPTPCSTTGFTDPVYRVTAFHYDRMHRARSLVGVDASLVFDVTDVANNYTIRCKASKLIDEDKPNENRTCFEVGSDAPSPPTLDFNYIFASGRLSLRQSWACKRDDGSFP